MPIRPEHRHYYRKGWHRLALKLRPPRTGNVCECHGLCGGHAGPFMRASEVPAYGTCAQAHGAWSEMLDLHLERMKANSPPAMAASDYVFPRVDGLRSSSGRPKHYWPLAVKAAGYPVGRKNNGWTPHDVRRLGIELLYEAGGQERDVMQYVGHHVASVHAMYLQRDSKRLARLAKKSAARLFDGEQPHLPGDPTHDKEPVDSEPTSRIHARGDPSDV